MGLIEELKEMDEKKKQNNEAERANKTRVIEQTSDLEEKYLTYNDWITNLEKVKKILENPDPKLDIPVLATKHYYINYNDIEKVKNAWVTVSKRERTTEDVVLTPRIMKLCNYIEKMSNKIKYDKITYTKSYREPTNEDKNEISHMKKKIKTIYLSDEKDEKCILTLARKRCESNFHSDYKGWLPYVYVDDDSKKHRWLWKNVGIDTCLKYALLTSVSDVECFSDLIIEPEAIREFENELKLINSQKNELAQKLEVNNQTENKITFASIIQAIKESYLGIGGRE